MFSSPDSHDTKPFSPGNGRPLHTTNTRKLPAVMQPGQFDTSITSTKLPIIIPASTKRQRTEPLEQTVHQRRRFVLPGVLFGSIVISILACLFVVPVDNNSQHQGTIAQAIGNLISTGHFDEVNPLQQLSTPTPSLLREGYCGGNDIWGTCATYITASGVMGMGQMQRPIIGAVITQAFGHPEYQLWCGCWKLHTGIDLAAPYGTPIMAADSGQVIWVGWDWSGLGWAVKINHGDYIATIYGHLDHYIVKVGQNVTEGQVIGYEGSTGASTGPHLHFMVLVNNDWVDPTQYVQLP
jgi:murein DD-endopeptidase MepM/ murein hydrolase activator NlpD